MSEKQEENTSLLEHSESSLDSICPVVLIATHQRVEITTKLLQKLKKDAPFVKIVLTVSTYSEEDYFKRLNMDGVYVFNTPNKPLGLKWQSGVEQAKKIKANPLIILGSDDQLGASFVKNACHLIEKYEFIGLKRFYVYHKRKTYTIDYKPIMPIGGGRIYSKKLLDKIKWKLFNPGKNKHLDDEGWKAAINNTDKLLLVSNIKHYGLELTALKGSWSMMNPFNPYHPNISVVCVE